MLIRILTGSGFLNQFFEDSSRASEGGIFPWSWYLFWNLLLI